MRNLFACWLVAQEMDFTQASSISKVFTTEMTEGVCSNTIQTLGERDIPTNGRKRNIDGDVKNRPNP